MKRAFTLLEIICAVVLIGVVTTLAIATTSAVSRGWEISTDYIDKMQRTDYAINQVVSALKSMYYPCNGQQDKNYGFVLFDNGNGEDPRTSDVLEWSRLASVGSKDKAASTIHRVQLMILEEGDRKVYRDGIETTGLYMRRQPDAALLPKDGDEGEYSFSNDEMYEPVLVADGIVGFNCRILEEKESGSATKGENEKTKFKDNWDSSNSVPYKVELTFRMADPDGKSYRSNTAPLMRIVKIPIHEQSKDGAIVPGSSNANDPNAPPPPSGGAPGARGGGGRTDAPRDSRQPPSRGGNPGGGGAPGARGGNSGGAGPAIGGAR